MEKFKISDIGWAFFWLSFALGNVCLLGYFFSENIVFAIAGLFLLFYGGIINLIVFFGLLIYGSYHSKDLNECTKGALIILINIPIALLYYFLSV